MDGSVTVSGKPLAKTELDRAFTAVRRYARNSRGKSTWRAYRSDWQQFEAWCQSVDLQPLPAEPETIAMFVANQASDGLNPSTLTRRLAAIRLVHLGAGHASPHNTLTVTEVMLGIRRDWGRPPDRKAPATDDQIKKMVDAVDKEMAKGLRDRALLLLGFAGAFRRSELVALNTWNLEYRDEGVKVTIEDSKTDREAQGQVIAIVRQPDSPYCPVQALEDWLTVAKIERGALFRRMHRGDISMRLNMRRWNGWIGSTTDAYSNRSATSRQQSLSRHTMINWRVTLKQPDSHKRVSGIPGAVQHPL